MIVSVRRARIAMMSIRRRQRRLPTTHLHHAHHGLLRITAGVEHVREFRHGCGPVRLGDRGRHYEEMHEAAKRDNLCKKGVRGTGMSELVLDTLREQIGTSRRSLERGWKILK